MSANRLRTILSLINEKRNNGVVPVLVAIDGAGGAGKSTLARQILEKCGDASIIEMDDFYRPEEVSVRRAWTPQEGYDNFFDWQRFQDQVLKPIQNGRPATFQVYNWMANKLDGWKTLPTNSVIIVEGVYALRPVFRSSYHISLFIETPKEVCLRRLRARTDAEEDIQMWRAAEEWYFTNIKPQKICDLVISGC